MAVPVNNRTRVAGASLALFLLALFLTVYSDRNPSAARVGSALLSEITYPVQKLHHLVYGSTTGVWDSYLALLGTKEENRNLRARLEVLESENSRLRELQGENQRLRELLKVSEESELEGVVARVIGHDRSHWTQTILIDKGVSSGVLEGLAVVEGHGIVGQVVVAGPSSAKVLLITDHASGVDTIVQGSRARGVVVGSGRGSSSLRYVLKEEKLHIGDRIISSGMDGIYPKGLVLGIISDLQKDSYGLFQNVQVAPTVDFSKLENVLVVTKQREQLKLENPKITTSSGN